MSANISQMMKIEYRAVIKFFARKGLNATEITRELENIYKEAAPSYQFEEIPSGQDF